MTDKFYKFPKHWLTDEPYKSLSNDALIALMRLSSLKSLSEPNGWIDANGIPFLLVSQDTISKWIRKSPKTAKRVLTDLAAYRLLQVIKQAQGKSNMIYLTADNMSQNFPTPHPKVEESTELLSNGTMEVLSKSTEVLSTDYGSFVHRPHPKVPTIKNNILRNNIKTNHQDTQIQDNSKTKNGSAVSDVWNRFSVMFRTYIAKESKKPNGMEFVAEDFRYSRSRVDDGLFNLALDIAERRNARHPNYVYNIIDDWVVQGITTLELYNATKQKSQNKFQPAQQKSTIPDWTDPDYKNETSESERLKLEEIKRQTLERLRKEE